MANFDEYIQITKRRGRRMQDGTYNSDPNDAGNWSSGARGVGTFVGTMRSISAPVLARWRGRPVTASEMKALSYEEAKQIYKVKYWDAIRGDEIIDQQMAEFVADMKSSGGGIKSLQRALNTAGEKMPVDGNFGTKTLNALNRQIQQDKPRIYNLFRAEQVKHYETAKRGYSNWLDSLDKDYPVMPSQSPRKVSAIIFVVLVIIAITIWYFFFRSKNPH